MHNQLKRFALVLLAGIIWSCGLLRAAGLAAASDGPALSPTDDPKDTTLRVLCIGNSYTLDATRYLERMAQQAGLGAAQYGVCCVVHGGASLEYWSNHLAQNREIEEMYGMGGCLQPENKHWTLRELLREPWDVVVLQQCSKQSDNYSFYSPHADMLVNTIRQECPNPEVKLAWHMTWSHALTFSCKPYSRKGWKNIAGAVQQLLGGGGFDVLIPSGTAIQNARAFTDDYQELTRDGTHIAYGAGHYLLALTWFETLVAPAFGVSLMGVPPSAALCEANADKRPFFPVTEENWAKFQECVACAIASPFELAPFAIPYKSSQHLYRLRFTEEPLYDLSGRRLSRPLVKGMYICGKEKCFVR